MRHFLDIADYSPAELTSLLDLAIKLKRDWRRGGNRPLLRGKVLGMLFQKPSLRTRVSFDMAMRHLGGDALYLSPSEVGLGQRESTADVSRVLSSYVQGIMARVFAHDEIVELARFSRVPVINGLSDSSHPCQALSDALTIRECFGSLAGIRVAYVGDGNNVATSLLQICAKLGSHFSAASPPGYEVSSAVVERARVFAEESGSQIALFRDPQQAVRGANVIYTDTWTSMGQESQAEARKKIFPPYQVNAALVSAAAKDAIVMHCLPAHRGQEITDEVADGPHSVLFLQAENRMHAQKAILATLLSEGG
ncbi:MAG: ornithine carbamoyltransferase [Anaerolineales bacterium]|jgi:ornithine carbamoyltransferase